MSKELNTLKTLAFVQRDKKSPIHAIGIDDLTPIALAMDALEQKLRAVEAERDEARNGVKKSAEAYGALMEKAEKLRAELERKDAALRAAVDEIGPFVFAFCGDKTERADAIRGIVKELRAALQPKEPPCQTA